MLNENIKAWRNARCLSQEDLAGKLCVVRQTVSKWEKGLSVPDAEMVSRIAKALETSVEALLGETVPITDTQDALETLVSLKERLAGLNEHFARQQEHRRIFWRSVSITVAAISFLILTSAALAFIHNVIGGVDGPTHIFVTKVTPQLLSLLLVAAAGVAALVGIRRTRKH